MAKSYEKQNIAVEKFRLKNRYPKTIFEELFGETTKVTNIDN